MESEDMAFSCLENDVRELRQLREQESLMEKEYESALKSLKIEKGKVINARVLLEEELRIKEQNVKERRNEVKRLNEIELQKQESMINVGRRLNDNLDFTEQQGKSSKPRKDTDAEGTKISKNGLDYDFIIAKSSHDKDKTEVQWSNNELFQNDFYSNHEVEKTNENNKALKEANDLLTKELKMYKERLIILGNKPVAVLKGIMMNCKLNFLLYDAYELRDENVQLHVIDYEETLQDAEKSLLKIKEFQKDEKLLKDRLLEVTLAEDVKNLVITSCVEIGNKNLQDEIERFSKESKDVSNESKTVDTFCNDAFDVTEEMSKIIVDMEKDLSKLEAKTIAFEIALQYKSQENNSLKTLQKENENFLASLQIKNAHLKQAYKEVFVSVQRSRVETNQCDEIKVKFDFAEIETKNIELKHQVASLLKENKHLKLVYKTLFDSIKRSRPTTQNVNIPQNEVEKLKSEVSEVVDNKLDHILGKNDSSSSSITESNISELEKESGEKKNNYENAKCKLQTKIVELEKVLNQKTKDFDDVKLELSNRTAKFEAYFEKLKNTKVVLERKLALKVDDSKAEKDQFLKEINHLRTQLENLKGKFVETKFDKPSI
ncbi:hypothetical protein Tco_0233139 [Tanacetum coccineum]